MRDHQSETLQMFTTRKRHRTAWGICGDLRIVLADQGERDAVKTRFASERVYVLYGQGSFWWAYVSPW